MGGILVFGREGQVGRALMQRGGLGVSGRSRSEADITNPDAVRAAIAAQRPEIVVNAAAYTAVDKAETEAERAFAVNALGAGHIAGACAEAGVPLIHISTDYVFDGSKAGPYVESDPVAPLGVYGASKEAGERAVRDEMIQHVILRTAWVYAGHGANFVRTMLRLSAERPSLRVVDDQRGCPTHAGDLADAILAIARAVQAGRPVWGTFHACGAEACSWADFADGIVAAAGRTAPVTRISTADYPTPARRPANSVLECGRLAASYGIRLPGWRQSLPAAVAELMADMKERA